MKITRLISLIIFFVITISISIYCLLTPIHNWDIIPYTGSVYSLETADVNLIHSKTYQTLKENTDSGTFLNLTASNSYRKDVYECAECFHQQLQFYKVKPLYIFIVYGIYKSGVPVIHTFRILPVISYIAICLVCLIWLMSVFKNSVWGIIFSCLLSVSPFLIYLASITTPDILSAAVVFTSFYFLIHRKNITIFSVLMILSCLIRQDNLLTLIFTAVILFIYKGEAYQKNKLIPAVSVIISFILIQIIHQWAGSYGWMIYFEHSFNNKILRPAEYTGGFSIYTYLQACKTGLAQFKFDSFMTEALILAALIYIKKNLLKNYKADFELLVLFSIIAAGTAHIIIYPSAEDRFFAAQYMTVNIIFLKNIYEKFGNVNQLSAK